MKERTILVDGFSKTYCMTGWRLGWVACPKHLAEKIKLLTVHSVGCVAAFTQIAGVEALTGPQDSVKAMRDEYRVRRDFVVDALNDIPGISCPVPKGAFYAFPSFDFPDVTAQELADYLLEDARVALLPGTDFGAAGERHLRLSYVGELSDLREAMARIKTSLAKRFPDFV
jgi:aspartate/methionine/tyrosine aminotransferase